MRVGAEPGALRMRHNSMMRMALPVAALALVLSSCSTEAEMRAIDHAEDPAAAPAPLGEMPTAVPAANGPVSTSGLVTVLDNGTGPQLCSAVMDSYPPQCQGAPLAGWDWAAHPEHEEASGTRWGDFALTGTFDGTTLTVTDAIPAALYDAMPVEDPIDFSTPCEEPEGGWAVVDESKANPEAMDGAFTVAQQLPGYGEAWIDQNGATGEAQNDPSKIIINVAVTEDLAGAEQKLRELWGGALCVSEAEHTEAELNEIGMAVQELPGVTSSGAVDGVVEVGVLYDDGSLQSWADETYGEGRVRVASLLG